MFEPVIGKWLLNFEKDGVCCFFFKEELRILKHIVGVPEYEKGLKSGLS